MKFIGELPPKYITRIDIAVKVHLDLYLKSHHPTIAETLAEWQSNDENHESQDLQTNPR